MDEPTKRPRGRPRRYAEGSKPQKRERPRAFKALKLEAPDAGAGTSLQLADMPLKVAGVRHALSATQIEQARSTLTKLAEHDVTGYAANSRRAMRSNWRNWLSYCVDAKCPVMPIGFDDLAGFVQRMVTAGYKRATIELAIFTLRKACAIFSCPDPMSSIVAEAWWRDLCRDHLTKRQKQATGFREEHLEAVLAALDPEQAVDVRDAALVSFAYDLQARASELVAAIWDQLDLDGIDGTYHIDRAKTDQEGVGRTMYVSPLTTTLLRGWRALLDTRVDKFPDGMPIFLPWPPGRANQELTKGLHVNAIERIFKRCAKLAGLTHIHWSGHSARVGSTQDNFAAGMELSEIMHHGRWKTPTMPQRYGEKEISKRMGRERFAKLRKTEPTE